MCFDCFEEITGKTKSVQFSSNEEIKKAMFGSICALCNQKLNGQGVAMIDGEYSATLCTNCYDKTITDLVNHEKRKAA